MQLIEFIRRPALLGALFIIGVATSSISTAAELLMVEQHDCPYCERFLSQIGPVYPKTEEGKIAPLKQVNLSDPLETQYQLVEPVVVTPTFILIDNGKEIDRLVGYQGDDFFWFLLGDMLEKLDQ